MTLKFFFVDKLKKMAVMLPLNAAIMSGVVWVINKFGEHFYVYAFVFVSAVVFIMMTVYPEFIAPLFDTYSPLKDGELKTKVIFNDLAFKNNTSENKEALFKNFKMKEHPYGTLISLKRFLHMVEKFRGHALHDSEGFLTKIGQTLTSFLKTNGF